MSSSSFHESDLVQAISQLRVGKIFGYRDFIAYISSLGIPLVKRDDLSDMTYINSGSYSSIYRTTHIPDGKLVAFKRPKLSLSRREARVEEEAHNQALSSIIQEIRILAHSNLSKHPNLPRIVGVSLLEESLQDGISPCIVEEFAFSDLGQYLTTAESLLAPKILRLILDIAQGLCALHSFHLVHGDIHPKNILLFKEEGDIRATVGDLGTCGVEFSKEFIPGTRDFWAPECHLRSRFYKDYANGPARDVYTFGLLVQSIISETFPSAPFPSKQQFEIQHDQTKTLHHLKRNTVPIYPSESSETTQLNKVLGELEKVVLQTVVVNPVDRPNIALICHKLECVFEDRGENVGIKDIAATSLMTNPTDPRVRIINRMPLPSGVISKLTSEYRIASRDTQDPKTALVMASLYSGVIGLGLQYQLNYVAKIQWLFKSIELGNYASIIPAVSDKNTVNVIKEYGIQVLLWKHPSFEGPQTDLVKLVHKLNVFANMPDPAALDILKYLGVVPPRAMKSKIRDNAKIEHTRKSKIRSSLPNLFHTESLTMHRDFDAGPPDSDASDLHILTRKSVLEQYAYNDALEHFISAASARDLSRQDGNVCMATAIYGGAKSVAQYIMHFYGIMPDQEYIGTSHLDLSVLFNRIEILKAFLKSDVTMDPAADAKLSCLHLASRHDSKELITMLCEYLQKSGNLQAVLRSATSEGRMAQYNPVYTAMVCQAYVNVITLLDFGADPDSEDEDGQRLIHVAILPSCPAPPISVLVRLIEAGANINATNDQNEALLQTAIGSTNILAVYYLLSAGADCSILSAAGETAIEAAEEITRTMQTEGPIKTLNEEGEVCEGGHADCYRASQCILAMVRVATAQTKFWKTELQRTLDATDHSLRNKMWIVDRVPTNFYVQIVVPP